MLVDLILVLVVAIAAVEGLRLGAIMQVVSFGSFWVGLVLGALLASVLAHQEHSAVARVVVVVLCMLGIAILFGTAGRFLGARLFMRVHRGRFAKVDSGLGVVVAVGASLLAMWLIASTLVNSASTGLNAAIAQSRIIRALDRVLPPPPSVFGTIQSFLSNEGFPSVFAQVAPLAAGPVALPSQQEFESATTAASASTFKIEGFDCGDIQEGSGFVVGPSILVTNAHVVAGISHPEVIDRGRMRAATVLLFDPSFDLAVLRVPGLSAPVLPLDAHTVARGAVGAVLGYPEGGPLTSGPAGVRAEFQAEGRDIYGGGLTVRDVYELQAIVRPGNSGGPLVTPAGEVIGVVFSRSTTDPSIGYALASPGVLSRVDHAETLTAEAATGTCLAH